MQTFLKVTTLFMRTSAVVLFAIMLALFFANVMVRTVLPEYSSAISWAEEAARIAMIWATFLIAGHVLERGSHIAMTSLVVHLPRAARLAVRRGLALLGTALFAYLSYVCIEIMVMVFRSGQIFPDMRISVGYLYLGPALGLALLATRYAIEIIHPNDPAGAAADTAQDAAA